MRCLPCLSSPFPKVFSLFLQNIPKVIFISCIFMGYPLIKFCADSFTIQGDTLFRKIQSVTDRRTQGDGNSSAGLRPVELKTRIWVFSLRFIAHLGMYSFYLKTNRFNSFPISKLCQKHFSVVLVCCIFSNVMTISNYGPKIQNGGKKDRKWNPWDNISAWEHKNSVYTHSGNSKNVC